MSYYKILGLNKEPFSTSPDPEFFYQSVEHRSALYRLRIALELKRGLSVILGDVGMGKTTLSRRLSQVLSNKQDIIMTMVLNPIYETEEQFLADLAERFHLKLEMNGKEPKAMDYLKSIERFLFEKGVEQGKTIVLLIDEAQKLDACALEVLRTLLNYETNEFKTLQLILMSQMELLPRISRIKNLWDRIALKYVINPLEEDEVKEMIKFRLKQAGYSSDFPLFSEGAVKEIYNWTQGYPRKIAFICHDALEYLIMHNKRVVEREVVLDLISKEMATVRLGREAADL